MYYISSEYTDSFGYVVLFVSLIYRLKLTDLNRLLDEFLCTCIVEGMKPLESFDLLNEVSAQYMRDLIATVLYNPRLAPDISWLCVLRAVNRVCALFLSSSVPSDISANVKATHGKPTESLVTVQRWLRVILSTERNFVS